MSNLMINIRFWYYHLQISTRSMRVCRNKSLKNLNNIPKIQVFKLFWYNINM